MIFSIVLVIRTVLHFVSVNKVKQIKENLKIKFEKKKIQNLHEYPRIKEERCSINKQTKKQTFERAKE